MISSHTLITLRDVIDEVTGIKCELPYRFNDYYIYRFELNEKTLYIMLQKNAEHLIVTDSFNMDTDVAEVYNRHSLAEGTTTGFIARTVRIALMEIKLGK